MKKRIVIFHFLPIEVFPPVMNILDYLSRNSQGFAITVITTYPNKSLTLFSNEDIEFYRFKNIDASSKAIHKIVGYLRMYIGALYYMFKLRPSMVFYFETLSSLSPLIYKWFYKKTKLYIHYHEIVTVSELKSGRPLNKLLNKLEQRFYNKAHWLSQTNAKRMEIFLQQYHLDFNPNQHKYLPNYPSKTWLSYKESNKIEECESSNDVIKLVHIGALSLTGMYLNEILEAFGDNPNYELYFYSHSTNHEIIEKLKLYQNVHFMGSINYNDIPKLKKKYDVGLVLYKGNSHNVRYSAPNKIFEYLALDLDVWCSDKLVTASDHVIEKTYPKMLMVDFENLESLEIKKLINRDGLEYKSTPYYCEAVYKSLLNNMTIE